MKIQITFSTETKTTVPIRTLHLWGPLPVISSASPRDRYQSTWPHFQQPIHRQQPVRL